MLEVKNLTKTYVPKKGVPVVALNNVSLKINDNGLVFILGKSGSGKSTLLNLLGGLDNYDDGDIIIKGKSTKDFSQGDFDSYRNTYVGFIFQEYNLLDDFSVGANIGLAIELQGRKASNEEINDILNKLDLQGYANRKTNELSGGQKQRVAIARALVKNPDIILADEPTGALDSKTGLQIFDILKQLAKDKLVLVVSHDREFAEFYGDRVIELADGEIISDITKTTITKDELETGNIQFIEKEGVVVKEGYKLTLQDLKQINEYLEKEKSFSITSKSDADFYTRSVFQNTEDNRESAITYGEEFKMLKSRLPFWMAFKMGVSGLSHKKVRLFFTILFSLVSFTLFGVADSLAVYNRSDASVNSIIDGGINAVALAKTMTYENTDNDYAYTRTIDVSLSNSDIAALNAGVGKEAGISFKPVFVGGARQGYSFNISENYSPLNITGSNPFYLDSIAGLVEYNENELAELDFELTGALPSQDDEIVITSYIFDHFATKGYAYYDEETNETIHLEAATINNYNNLIGKKINLHNYALKEPLLTFKITGVLDTKFDTERYESLKKPTGNYFFLSQEFMTTVEYGFHGLGFVNPGFINILIAKEDTSELSLQDSINLQYTSEAQQLYFPALRVEKLENVDQKMIAFFDQAQNALADNEILVDYESFKWSYNQQFSYNDATWTIAELESSLLETLVREYAEVNYLEAQDGDFFIGHPGASEIPEEEKIERYSSYLAWGDGRMNNPYGDKNGIDFQIEAVHSVFSLVENTGGIYLEQQLYNNYTYQSSKDSAKIAGVNLNSLDGSYQGDLVIISDSFYNEIENMHRPEPYKFALAKMPTNREDIKKIADFSLTSKDGFAFPLKNSASPMLDMASGLVESSADIFLYIGIGFAVFSALLLSNFIATSVSFKKRDIGILRALGARSSDVFRIFFNESLVIGLINFVLSAVAAFLVVGLINVSLRTDVGLTITLFNFSIRQVIIILSISVFVAIVASFLPVNRIARKKPVDAIRDK